MHRIIQRLWEAEAKFYFMRVDDRAIGGSSGGVESHHAMDGFILQQSMPRMYIRAAGLELLLPCWYSHPA